MILGVGGQSGQSHTVFVDQGSIDFVNGAGDAMAGAAIVQLVLGQQLPQAISSAGLTAAQAVLTYCG